jgi:hypothetical protein
MVARRRGESSRGRTRPDALRQRNASIANRVVAARTVRMWRQRKVMETHESKPEKKGAVSVREAAEMAGSEMSGQQQGAQTRPPASRERGAPGSEPGSRRAARDPRVKRAIKGGILANMLGRAALSTLSKTVFRVRRRRGGRASERNSEPVRADAQTQGVVPAPPSELEPDPPLRAPSSSANPSGLVTSYPNRSEWESDVSERARQEIREGNRPPRTRGPTSEAD